MLSRASFVAIVRQQGSLRIFRAAIRLQKLFPGVVLIGRRQLVAVIGLRWQGRSSCRCRPDRRPRPCPSRENSPPSKNRYCPRRPSTITRRPCAPPLSRLTKAPCRLPDGTLESCIADSASARVPAAIATGNPMVASLLSRHRARHGGLVLNPRALQGLRWVGAEIARHLPEILEVLRIVASDIADEAGEHAGVIDRQTARARTMRAAAYPFA